MLLCEQGSPAHFALAFNSQQTFLCVCEPLCVPVYMCQCVSLCVLVDCVYADLSGPSSHCFTQGLSYRFSYTPTHKHTGRGESAYSSVVFF